MSFFRDDGGPPTFRVRVWGGVGTPTVGLAREMAHAYRLPGVLCKIHDSKATRNFFIISDTISAGSPRLTGGLLASETPSISTRGCSVGGIAHVIWDCTLRN